MPGRKPKSPERHEAGKGMQSIQRAIGLLRLVVKHNDQGVLLPELAAQSGLHMATARRMLKALEAEGLITQDPISKLYHLGIDLYYFGAAAHQFNLRDRYRHTLVRIADLTQDTTFLVIRSGYDALVIDRVEGAFPIRTLTHEVGQRVPLGIGAGSTALLASLPEREMEAVIKANTSRYSQYNNRRIEDVRAQVRHCRQKGYAVSEGNVMPEAVAVGRPLRDETGDVVGAISVAAIFQRMQPVRREQVARIIAEEIAPNGQMKATDAPTDGTLGRI